VSWGGGGFANRGGGKGVFEKESFFVWYFPWVWLFRGGWGGGNGDGDVGFLLN